MKERLKKIFIIIILLVIFYTFAFFLGRYVETIFTFPGVEVSYDSVIKNNTFQLQFEEINIKNKRGENINGLFIDNKAETTIYYFHGNGGPLPIFYSQLKYYADFGYNVMVYDYPGYGKSTGFPYEADVITASEVFWEYLKKKKGLSEENLIVVGQSIGTAAAIQFVNNHKHISKLLLISPLSSRYDMSKHIFGFSLQKLFFLKNSFVSSEIVENFSVPVLIIHGNADRVIPLKQGKEVFSKYMGKKNFIEIDNFGHNGIIYKYGKVLQPIFQDFFREQDLNFPDNHLFLDIETKQKLLEKK